jgi:radical SAM superfamily enzyme YgiQ (UPF0313 family)
MIELAGRLKLFNQSRKRVLSFGANLRVVPATDYGRLFLALKEASFDSVNMGLESGSETVRRKYLHRDYSNDDIRRAVMSARDAGLSVNVFAMIGIPGERMEDFEQTVAFLREIQPRWVASYILFPYPGTQMAERVSQSGLLIDEAGARQERAQSVLDLPGFPRAEIQKQFDWLPYRVYKGHRNRLLLLVWTAWRKLIKKGVLGWKYYGI